MHNQERLVHGLNFKELSAAVASQISGKANLIKESGCKSFSNFECLEFSGLFCRIYTMYQIVQFPLGRDTSFNCIA